MLDRGTPGAAGHARDRAGRASARDLFQLLLRQFLVGLTHSVLCLSVFLFSLLLRLQHRSAAWRPLKQRECQTPWPPPSYPFFRSMFYQTSSLYPGKRRPGCIRNTLPSNNLWLCLPNGFIPRAKKSTSVKKNPAGAGGPHDQTLVECYSRASRNVFGGYSHFARLSRVGRIIRSSPGPYAARTVGA
jgi:hypothetical protein